MVMQHDEEATHFVRPAGWSVEKENRLTGREENRDK